VVVDDLLVPAAGSTSIGVDVDGAKVMGVLRTAAGVDADTDGVVGTGFCCEAEDVESDPSCLAEVKAVLNLSIVSRAILSLSFNS
jgi:hypothetical protein